MDTLPHYWIRHGQPSSPQRLHWPPLKMLRTLTRLLSCKRSRRPSTKLVVVGGRFSQINGEMSKRYKYGGKDTQKRSGRKSKIFICCAELSMKKKGKRMKTNGYIGILLNWKVYPSSQRSSYNKNVFNVAQSAVDDRDRADGSEAFPCELIKKKRRRRGTQIIVIIALRLFLFLVCYYVGKGKEPRCCGSARLGCRMSVLWAVTCSILVRFRMFNYPFLLLFMLFFPHLSHWQPECQR